MAKRWAAWEAAKVLKSGDKEDRIDIIRRFPLFATAAPEVLLEAIPNFVSARQVEKVLLNGQAVPNEDNGDDDVEEEKSIKKFKKDKKEKEVKKGKKKSKPEKSKSKKKAKKDEEDEDEFEDLEDLLEEDDEVE